MSQTYLLDTDICISLLRDQHSIKEKIKHEGIDSCAISEITILELQYGAINSQDPSRHLSEVEKMKSLFQVLLISPAFDLFAHEKVRLQRAGLLVPDFDPLIGCTALAHSLTVVTNNVKHLNRLQGITIENWREPKFNEFLK